MSAVDAANSVNYATGALYAPHGGLASLLNGATITTKQYFNNRLQPCRLSISTGSTPANCTSTTNGSVFDLAYDFDSEAAAGVQNNGNVGKITNKRSTSRTQSFTYDALNRLATAQSQATSGTLCWGLAYGYDVWANLLSATQTKCTASTLSLAVRATVCGVHLEWRRMDGAGLRVKKVAGGRNMRAAWNLTMHYDSITPDPSNSLGEQRFPASAEIG